MRRRYTLKFSKTFSYSATWRKGDRQEIISVLKGACLEAIKKHFEYLSTLPDDKLLEMLEENECDYEK